MKTILRCTKVLGPSYFIYRTWEDNSGVVSFTSEVHKYNNESEISVNINLEIKYFGPL